MEFIVFAVAVALLDLLASRFGTDSRVMDDSPDHGLQ
jgi:hypothetical protein